MPRSGRTRRCAHASKSTRLNAGRARVIAAPWSWSKGDASSTLDARSACSPRPSRRARKRCSRSICGPEIISIARRFFAAPNIEYRACTFAGLDARQLSFDCVLFSRNDRARRGSSGNAHSDSPAPPSGRHVGAFDAERSFLSRGDPAARAALAVVSKRSRDLPANLAGSRRGAWIRHAGGAICIPGRGKRCPGSCIAAAFDTLTTAGSVSSWRSSSHSASTADHRGGPDSSRPGQDARPPHPSGGGRPRSSTVARFHCPRR